MPRKATAIAGSEGRPQSATCSSPPSRSTRAISSRSAASARDRDGERRASRAPGRSSRPRRGAGSRGPRRDSSVTPARSAFRRARLSISGSASRPAISTTRLAPLHLDREGAGAAAEIEDALAGSRCRLLDQQLLEAALPGRRPDQRVIDPGEGREAKRRQIARDSVGMLLVRLGRRALLSACTRRDRPGTAERQFVRAEEVGAPACSARSALVRSTFIPQTGSVAPRRTVR